MQYSLLIAGTRSGSGKTSLSLALLAALKARGITVQSCKVGPDFIDPTQHSAITKLPSYNLDSWMGLGTSLERVYARMHANAIHNKAQMLLCEGVMGLFDGASGIGGPGSSAHMANIFNMPVLLVVDVRGMAQSVVALVSGFIKLHKNIAGIVCSHVGSERHVCMLKEAFAQGLDEHDPPVLGYLRREGHINLESRHLGLQMGHEQVWDEQKLNSIITWVEKHLDIDALLKRCLAYPPPKPKHTFTPLNFTKPTKRIAIASDAAFCFLYPDMPEVLAEMGAECVFFSPLKHAKIPENCHALYLPGGYPELFGLELSQNTSMLNSMRTFAKSGKKIYAECGGYMYLMKDIEYAERNYEFCNILPISAKVGEGKAALGYREVKLGTKCGRGHEFHYTKIKKTTNLPPLWLVFDRQSMPLTGGEGLGVRVDNIMASWIHLYPEGSRELLADIFELNCK